MLGAFPAAEAMLPVDSGDAVLVGRIDIGDGPTPIIVRDGRIEDVSRVASTVADLFDTSDPAGITGAPLFSLDELLSRIDTQAADRPVLLAPIDLQVVKACGVTFATSAVERVIEERARGDAAVAASVRASLEAEVGRGLRAVEPGSADAERLKQALIAAGMWSQYLEVAIGPDAEVFTKAPVLSSVGWGAPIGVRSDSSWNNPEPEVVLVVNPAGKPVGAMLGNDVNLRDFEGRSALLLGKAKDNNASCALGPFVRLFDERFTMDDVRGAQIALTVDGADGFRLEGASSMAQISRDPEELVRQTLSEHHYPDGFALFLGTLFAPIQDRDAPGKGFTHKPGDRVSISSDRLGALVNDVTTSAAAPPWRLGVRALFANLAQRGLVRPVGTTGV